MWRVMKLLILFIVIRLPDIISSLPIVLNTWPFTNPTDAAWTEITKEKSNAVNAVVTGCGECEIQQCDLTVGYGGDPDENGETTLDAMIMDGRTMDVGAVGCLRRIKNAIGVARAVMDYTDHTLLAGELATNFAIEMGFKAEDLHTNTSVRIWKQWKVNKCQPNHRMNVVPDPSQNCGPYKPKHSVLLLEKRKERVYIDIKNHDTIGMVAIDADGNIAAGTSTNGLNHKIPGRVGDSPIMGAGSYAKNNVGAAAATGDGDIMMRFLPSFQAVNLMELLNVDPTTAARKSLEPMIKYFPKFQGAIIVVDHTGKYGAACYGMSRPFKFSVRESGTSHTTVKYVNCMS